WPGLPSRPAVDVNVMIRPARFSRMWRVAGCITVKWPFRCTAITASHSSSLMLKIMRSRRMPAQQTRMWRSPNVLRAASMAAFPARIGAARRAAGAGAAARRLDLLHDRIGRTARRLATVDADAVVVDDHRGARGRQSERHRAPDSAACSRHHRDLAVE